MTVGGCDCRNRAVEGVIVVIEQLEGCDCHKEHWRCDCL